MTSRLTSMPCAAAFASILAFAVLTAGCPQNGETDSGPVDPLCGNGSLEVGEQCDPPAMGTCTTMCTFFPMCGNLTVEGAEECDPPDGAMCDASCRIITITTPNVGAPCVDDTDCGTGTPTLTPRCYTEAEGFPGGLCSANGCGTAAPCPTGATCVQLTSSTTACLPDCDPDAMAGTGGCAEDSPACAPCRSDEFGGAAYACYPATFGSQEGFCYFGCADDTGCNTGFRCETTSNLCVPDHAAAAGTTCILGTGICDGTGGTCAMDTDCSLLCNRPAGTCAGDALTSCSDNTECVPLCVLNFGTCNADGSPCTGAPGDCATLLCDIAGTGTCIDDGTITCTADADCQICNLAFGTCANSGTTACTTANQATVCAPLCDRPAGTCADDATVACFLDGDCTPNCTITPGGCMGSNAVCAADPDCVPGIGDPCTTNDDCPEFATCRTGTQFPGGYCTILYCGSFPGVPEFECPAGTFCPALNAFNVAAGLTRGTVNYCTPACTVDPLSADVECDANRGDNNDYICHEQFPDMSMTGLANFFDTTGAAGFCNPCSTYWLDAALCPTPAN